MPPRAATSSIASGSSWIIFHRSRAGAARLLAARATQYSRGSSDGIEKPRRTGSPGPSAQLRTRPGDDSLVKFQSRRRLRDVVFTGEQMNQRALDRSLPGRRVDLGAEQVGDVEHVAGAFAEGRDMGGGDVEVELRDRGRQLIQKARSVEAGDLDHGIAVRPLVVDGDLRLDHEGAHLAAVG